jgi:tetratricopeptide (TPR) repeat protein
MCSRGGKPKLCARLADRCAIAICLVLAIVAASCSQRETPAESYAPSPAASEGPDLRRRAQELLDGGEEEQALKCLDELLAADPGDRQLRASRILLLLKMHRHAEAKSDSEELVGEPDLEPSLIGLVALSFAMCGDNDRAVQHSEAALDKDTHCGNALFARAIVRLKAGEVEGAESDLEATVRWSESAYTKSNALMNLGLLQGLAGDRAQSELLFAQALALEPAAEPVAQEYRATIATFHGDYEDALVAWDQVLEIKRDSAACFLNRAKCYLHLDRFDRCIEDCAEVLRLEPENATARYRRGVAYARGPRDYVQAIADLSEAIRLDSKYVEAYEERAYAFYMSGQRALAAADRRTVATLKASPDTETRESARLSAPGQDMDKLSTRAAFDGLTPLDVLNESDQQEPQHAADMLD